MTGRLLMAGWIAPIGVVLTWLIQSTVLLGVGLLAGRSVRRWGPAVQSALHRTTLVAVLLCPIASMALASMGFSGLVIRLLVGRESDASGRAIADRDRDRL